MVLLEVGLEGSVAGAGRVRRLITERCARVSNVVIVVVGHAVLATPDTPADDGNAAQEDGTANTAYDAADDLLVTVAQAAAVIVAIILGLRKFCRQGLSSSDQVGLLAAGSNLDILAVANGRVDGDERADRRRYEGCGSDNGASG